LNQHDCRFSRQQKARNAHPERVLADSVKSQHPQRSVFRVKTKNHKILAQGKKELHKRLVPKAWADQPAPMFQAVNLHYEMSEKSRAIGFGGIGAIHTMVTRLGLDQAINEHLSLLKVHVPYFESDHMLNIAYNVVTGGTRMSSSN